MLLSFCPSLAENPQWLSQFYFINIYRILLLWHILRLCFFGTRDINMAVMWALSSQSS
jgi:hypothetical protein